MIQLTDEQKDLLILIGMHDDGREEHVVADGERIIEELIGLGLVCERDDGAYDLTEQGEELYQMLANS